MIDLKAGGSQITVEGPIFQPDANATLNRNIARAIVYIGEKALRAVQSRVTPHVATGQTRGGVEFFHSGPYSIWGKVRMKPDLFRSGDDNPRAPYIVAAVMESGQYARHETSVTTARVTAKGVKVRTRTKITRGGQRQTPLWMFRDTYRQLKPEANSMAESINLTQGLE